MSGEELIRLVANRIIKHLRHNAIPIGVSNRHVHLSKEHLDILFGPGYRLTLDKELIQPGEFAAKETVQLMGPKGIFSKVRIIGPLRPNTQVEISQTDAYTLGAFLQDSPGLVLVGPEGCLALKDGVIIAPRHIHLHPDEAGRLNLKNGDKVAVRVGGDRSLIFNNVLIRVHENYRREMHIDTDEANAAGVKNGDTGYIISSPEGG